MTASHREPVVGLDQNERGSSCCVILNVYDLYKVMYDHSLTPVCAPEEQILGFQATQAHRTLHTVRSVLACAHCPEKRSARKRERLLIAFEQGEGQGGGSVPRGTAVTEGSENCWAPPCA